MIKRVRLTSIAAHFNPTMGLHAKGGRGVKPQLLNGHWDSHVFRMYHELCEIPPTIGGASRLQTSCAIDGNVVLCRTPQNVTTLRAWVSFFASQIMAVVEASALNVIVFDEPENLTPAKRAEQANRDAAVLKTCVLSSVDCPQRVKIPTDDAYTTADLEQPGLDIHKVKNFRAARNRLFDEVVRRGFTEIAARIQTSDKKGTVLLVDGLDPRGANRPIGEQRTLELYGVEGCSLLPNLTRADPIGEGDLKLAWVQERIRQLARENVIETTVHLTLTIDTDSFAIELLEEGRRRCEAGEDEEAGEESGEDGGESGGSTVAGILVLYEKSGVCLSQLEGCTGDETRGFLVCNFSGLYDHLSEHLWSHSTKLRNSAPTRCEQRCAICYMVAGWILSGCDFCDLNGMTAELVLDVLPAMLAQPEARKLLTLFINAWEGGRRHLARLTPALQYLVRMCSSQYSERPRADKLTVYTMKTYNSASLKRCIWTLAYWNNNEMVGNLNDFGFSNDDDEINRLQYRKSSGGKLNAKETARLAAALCKQGGGDLRICAPDVEEAIVKRRVQARLV